MLSVCQRLHGDHIMAEVAPVEGMGTWRAWLMRIDTGDWHHAVGSSFAMLVDAPAAADQLAVAKFNHDCDGRCAAWRPQPESAKS